MHFLGCHIRPGYLRLAIYTINNFVKHIKRLYEQEAGENRVADYVTSWLRWAVSPGVEFSKFRAFDFCMDFCGICLQPFWL